MLLKYTLQRQLFIRVSVMFSLIFDRRVLDILRQMQSRDETNNAYVDSAIVNLLNFNLSAKYALTGHLCMYI